MKRRGWLLAVAAGLVAAIAIGVVARRAPAPAPKGAAPSAPARFVGSQACAGCHAQAYARWQSSQHALAMQHATDKTVLGDFGGAKFRYADIDSTFYRRDGRFFARTDGPNGKLGEFEIKYTFGVYPLQQYLVEFPGGRLQALSIAWDARPKAAGGQRWFHLYPKERIDYRDELHWTKRQQNWNFMCADCHSTDVKKNYDAASDTFKTTWSEISVGCEQCHGPGSRHAADPKQALAKPDLDTCAQCHARRSQIAEGFHGGERFLDHYRPELLAPGLYWPDGQQRDEVYIWGSFLQSRMHRLGVTCGNCHEPHTAKLRADGNAVCAQCHEPKKFDAPAHHFHRAGARCVDCHMPTTTYMVVDPRRDHSLRIPRPDLTASLGVPNACNGCHADKSARWADEALLRWYGQRPKGFQHFAHALAEGSGADLAALAQDPSQPEIARASALAELERRPAREAVDAVRSGLAQADPLLRLGALGALRAFPPDARLAMAQPLLEDPLRLLRIEAASAVAGAPGAEALPAFQRAAAEFERTQRLNADRPEARVTLGAFLAQRGQADRAEAELRSAIALAPEFEPAYVNLADVYRMQGRDAEGLAALDEGLKQAPRSAVLHHARGLALVRLKRLKEALPALERAARLAPGDARFAYVYAVALNEAGRKREALAELDRALERHPRDAQLLSARQALSR
jgi:predicted CXXCH cytochrome family protein